MVKTPEPQKPQKDLMQHLFAVFLRERIAEREQLIRERTAEVNRSRSRPGSKLPLVVARDFDEIPVTANEVFGCDAMYHEGEILPYLEDFVEFARAQLRKNQPVSMEYLDSGFAIRFQDSTVIPFVTGEEIQSTGGVGGCIPVTKPEVQVVKGMVQTPSFEITGKKE